MIKHALYACLTFTLMTPALLMAEKNAELTPVLVKLGKPSQSDSFDSKSLSKQWAANKGEWKIDDGVLVGKELASDKHAAVMTWKLPNRNSVIRCSFQLKDTNFFHVSLNFEKGHLFRIMINQSGMILRTDKNNRKAKNKPVTLAQVKGKIEPGKWYTLQLEMQGEKVVAQIDNGMKVEGHHPSLDADKTGYRFVMKGDSLLLDDMTAWKLP